MIRYRGFKIRFDANDTMLLMVLKHHKNSFQSMIENITQMRLKRVWMLHKVRLL